MVKSRKRYDHARNIAQRLSEKDPDNRSFYEENLERYLASLEELDQQAKENFNRFPKRSSPVREPSNTSPKPTVYRLPISGNQYRRRRNPAQIKNLVDQLQNSAVASLFVNGVNTRPMQSVSRDAGIPIFGTVFTDSIAEPEKKATATIT